MKVPVDWLRDYVPVEMPLDELAHRLAVTSCEVERVSRRGIPWENGNHSLFVVGHVLSAEKHPNADRLQLCKVDVGEAEPAQIVCGAWNFGAGATVAVARPGATMPDGLVLVHDWLVILHPPVPDAQAGAEGLAALLCGLRALGLGRQNGGFGIKRFSLNAMSVAALIQKELRQIQVAAFAGGAIECDQGQLHFLMSVHVIAFAGAEDAVNMIGEPPRRVEHPGLPGQFMMGDGHLEEVARVVHLVLQAQIVPALVLVLHNVIRDQEPVLLLGGEDAIENAFHALAQRIVAVVLQGIDRAFQRLMQIRVERMMPPERAGENARGFVEVGHVPVLLQAV
ncbi:MAG: hypothetical protein NTW72_07680 [Gemmatimonadetes bacterium]|nr:hypothetical protein [Gemmatimonadota bacterium]